MSSLSLLLSIEDIKIRVVVFEFSLSYFNCSKISNFIFHSSSSGLGMVLHIGAFSLACDRVSLLVVIGDGANGGAVAFDRDSIAEVVVSFSIFLFLTDGASVCSSRVRSGGLYRHRLGAVMAIGGDSDWLAAALVLAIESVCRCGLRGVDGVRVN